VAGRAPFFIVVPDVNFVALAPRAAGKVLHCEGDCDFLTKLMHRWAGGHVNLDKFSTKMPRTRIYHQINSYLKYWHRFLYNKKSSLDSYGFSL
jgi:hypothetical protein